MEPAVGELQGPRVGSSNLLDLPNLCPWDSDDELLSLGGITPKSSPIPKRRSSVSSSSEDDSQSPSSNSRRVSFADTFGLSLVSVKQFDSWPACDPTDPLEGDLVDAKEYILNLHFALPLMSDELLCKVREQKLELESLELLPGTTTLKGIVRVLNICFDKLVYIRTSLDCWSSHFDLLAEYVPGSNVEGMDCFSFKLTLVPPFGEEGARVDFCLRYETPLGTFWANNSGQNYVLFCRDKVKEQDENENKLKPKSCLKSIRSNSNTEESPEVIQNCETTAVSKPLGVGEEKIQAQPLKHQEENSRNRSRRSRRKAARMAKIQQYFAQREEKDHEQMEKGTKTDTNEQASKMKEEQSNVSTALPKTESQDIISSPAALNKTVDQTSSEDTNSKQVPTVHTQLKNLQPEFNSQAKSSLTDAINIHKNAVGRASRALENSQDNETVSLRQHLHNSQISEKCVRNSVEKAWESFEKGAVGQMGNPSEVSGGETDHRNEIHLQNTSCNFTFATIVAPLYQQVFERFENDRRELVSRPHKAAESVGKLKGESVRVVTYPSYSKTQSTKSRPNPCISQKHDVYHGTCKEACPQYLRNKKDTTEKVSETELQDSIAGNPQDQNNSQAKTAQMMLSKHKALLANQCLVPEGFQNALSWEESTLDQAKEMAEMMIQEDDFSISRSENMEYTQNDNLQSEGSPETSHYSRIPEDFPIGLAQSQLDSSTLKQSPSVVFENQLFDACPASQIILSDDMTKIQDNESQTQTADGTPDTKMRDLEESHVPIPEPSFHADISINVTSNISGTLMLSQNLTQATIQPKSPDITYHIETTGSIPVQFQVTEATQLIQDSNITQYSTDCHELHNVDGWEKIIHFDSEPSESQEGTAQYRISPNPQHGSKINKTPTHLVVNVPCDGIDLDGSNNTYESVLPEREVDICKANEQTVYVDKMQASMGMEVNQTEKIVDVEDLQKQQESSDDDEKEKKVNEQNMEKCEDILPQQNKEEWEVDQELLPQQNMEEQDREQNYDEWESEQSLFPEQNIEKRENAKYTLSQQINNERQDYQELLPHQNIKEYEEHQELLPQQNIKQCEEHQELLPQHNIKEWEDNEELLPQQNIKECDKDQELLPQQNIKECEDDQELLSHQIINESVDDQELFSQHNRNECENEKEFLYKQIKKKLEHPLPQQIKNERQDNLDVQPQQCVEDLENAKDFLLHQSMGAWKDDKAMLPQLNLKKWEEDQGIRLQQNVEEWKNAEELWLQPNTKVLENKNDHNQHNMQELENAKDHLPQQSMVELEDDQDISPNRNIEESLKIQTQALEITNVEPFMRGAYPNMEHEQQKSDEYMDKSNVNIEEKEISRKTDSSLLHTMTKNTDDPFSDRGDALENNCDQEDISCRTGKEHEAVNANDEVQKYLETISTYEQTEKSMDDSASTESLSDEEIELCLHRLRNSQQSGFREAISMGKRPSISRIRSVPSPMPSISEYINENEPCDDLLDDVPNEEMMELPLVDDKVTGSNLLWWREFFSSDNRSTIIVYTLLLAVFLVTAYFCDFIACFGLYLLAIYCLYFQRQKEPLKSS